MSVLSSGKVSVQVMSEQQMEVRTREEGGMDGGREGGEGAHCYQSYSAILSSERLSFPRSERHNIVLV